MAGCTKLQRDPALDSGLGGEGGPGDGGVDGEAPDERLDGSVDATRPAARDAADREDAEDSTTGPDGDAMVDESAPAYTVADYCDELVAAICAYNRAHEGDASAPCDSFPDIAQISAWCASGSMQAALEAGRVEFDTAAAKACVALNTPGEGELEWPYPLGRSELEAGVCLRVFVGQIELGEDCYVAAVLGTECSEGYCAYAGTCPGTCTDYGAVGDPCDDYTLRCELTDYCRYDTATCASYGEQGDPCSDYALCGDELYCKQGECAPGEPDGTECGSDLECASLNCAWIDEARTQGLCTVPQPAGADCQVDDGCEDPLLCVVGKCTLASNDGRCRADENCTGSEACLYVGDGYRCETPIAQGEVCDFSIPCAEGLGCASTDFVTGVCLPPGIAGDECEGNRYCADGFYCTNDAPERVCIKRGEQGEPCSRYYGSWSCGDGLQCTWDEVCEPLGRAQGLSCDPSVEGGCESGTFCARTTHTCAPLRGADASCNHLTREGCQAGLYCACAESWCSWDPAQESAQETCKTLLPDNSVCNEGAQCASGNCDGTCAPTVPEPENPLLCNGL